MSSRPIAWREAWSIWTRIASLSFGGPAAQIAVMHRILVDEVRWVREEHFLHALNFCMLLPGPEAQQLATYIGWLTLGVRGGLLAGLLFILPGFLSILALSLLYTEFHHTAWIQGMFYGLKPSMLAVVAHAVVRVSQRVLKNGTMVLIAIAAFIAIFAFQIPFPVLIVAAAGIGWWGGRMAPEHFHVISPHVSPRSIDGEIDPEIQLHSIRPTVSRSLCVLVTGLAIWLGPIFICSLIIPGTPVLGQEGWFFSKTAVVTFGGAYSVLAYIAQQGVDHYGWLEPSEMLDGLSMAESTPGPLIQVVQFVGYLGAYRNPGGLSPLVAGLLGSLISTWVTFAPSFLWIFLGGPVMEQLRGNRQLHAALSTITAAVVGVIAQLSIWLTVHTWFRVIHVWGWGPLKLSIPQLTSVDGMAVVLSLVAGGMIFGLRWGLATTLGLSAICGIALTSFK